MSGATCPHHARAHPPATVAQVEHELGTPDAHTAQAWTASPPPLASSLLSPLTCRSARPPPCSPSTLPLPPASSVTASSAACFSPVYASRPAAPGSGVVSFVRARRALGFAARSPSPRYLLGQREPRKRHLRGKYSSTMLVSLQPSAAPLKQAGHLHASGPVIHGARDRPSEGGCSERKRAALLSTRCRRPSARRRRWSFPTVSPVGFYSRKVATIASACRSFVPPPCAACTPTLCSLYPHLVQQHAVTLPAAYHPSA